MIEEATQRLSKGMDLSAGQMRLAMEEIMSAQPDTAQIVAFLHALNKQGETIEEVTAAVEVMRQFATKINTRHKVILDTCGTGADRSGIFNVSTVAAFVASGCGIAVAKHGNRSVSSLCGSADVLESLGININMPKELLEKCLDDIGIVFLFAQSLHPAMKYAMPARKQIGARTVFNILGPLSNPAGATHQLVGVYDKRWTEILAQVLKNLGTVHALVVHGDDGWDEITTTTNTHVAEVYQSKINSFTINPQDLGFKEAKSQDLLGGTVASNARTLLDILNGKEGPKRDIVILNAAAAIYAADRAKSIKEGIKLAQDSIDSQNALKKLEMLKKYSQR